MNKATFNDGKAPAAFQFMPPGESVICATVNGKPGRRRVFVDKSSAERLQKDLEGKVAAAQAGDKARPCGLFDHKSGPASFIPTRFYWDDERGVMCECEWTDAGKRAVEGRNYTYFSPCFRLAKDGRVMGLQDGVEVGSMVNNPAFEAIEPIAASKADEPADDSEDVVNVNGGAAEKPECEPDDKIEKMGLDELRAELEKRHAESVIERIKARISELEQKEKETEAANPYGCNQYGHGFKREHEGISSNPYSRKEPKGKSTPSSRESHGSGPRRLWTVNKRKKEGGSRISASFNEPRYTMNQTINRIIQKVRRAAEESEEVAAAVAAMPERVADEFEAVEAANPYGCNQYGHGYKMPHHGMQKGQKKGEPGWSPRRDSRKVKAAEPEGMEDDDNAEDKRKQYEDELEKLRAACEHEQDKDKKAVLKKRLEEMDAANPYGCNPYGHGFKRPHSGYGGGGQKTFNFGETKEKKQPRKNEDLNELEKRRKELVRKYKK